MDQNAKPCKLTSVNRRRRTYYIFAVTFISMGFAFYLAVKGGDTLTVRAAIDGFLSLAAYCVVAYVFGHSIDRSGVLSRIGSSRIFHNVDHRTTNTDTQNVVVTQTDTTNRT